MSAFTADGDFVPRLPAHPLRADATADPSFGRLIAISGHSHAFSSAGILPKCLGVYLNTNDGFRKFDRLELRWGRSKTLSHLDNFFHVYEADVVAIFQTNDALGLQLGHGAADGFRRKPEIVAKIRTGHRQEYGVL